MFVNKIVENIKNIIIMQKGHIGVTSDNIFPIIKKFLYSDHEIFLREIVSNAVDATQKIKTLSALSEFKGDLGELSIKVSIDKENGTLTISDRGIGMTQEEVEKYINQIAFSGAEEFVEKYKDDAGAIIGHFGLGFYSSFMVSKKVEINTKSHKDEPAVLWSCTGSPEYELGESTKTDRGTDIILHIDDDNKDFLEEQRINELLSKYCKFLPIAIEFGTEKEYKDGKEESTGKVKIVNDTNPAWTKKPAELKDEDYSAFYKDLYPAAADPLFHIHINIDYPFNLTGILYFPKIAKNIEIQKNKIQLYCNQVFVTDSIEGIVPDFLTLLHGVIDSPDIPLNVSRSYLQSDRNVKKISGHITRKVADKLQELFNADRTQFEAKWDDLKLFVQYGMVSEEKFAEKSEKLMLLKNTDDNYFTLDEYKEIIKTNQEDKDKNLIYLYTSNIEEQYSFVQAAKEKGYDVLSMEGQLDSHFINYAENKLENSRFVRVDSDIVEKLIAKDEDREMSLTSDQQSDLIPLFNAHLPQRNNVNYIVAFEALDATSAPVLITQNEFMRRMKDMSEMQGGGMSMYGNMPDSYNLVVNANHPLVNRIKTELYETTANELTSLKAKIATLTTRNAELEKVKADKKEEEISQAEKEEIEDIAKKIGELNKKKESIIKSFSLDNKLTRQIIDLALLSNNMLKGQELNNFVKRSIELI